MVNSSQADGAVHQKYFLVADEIWESDEDDICTSATMVTSHWVDNLSEQQIEVSVTNK